MGAIKNGLQFAKDGKGASAEYKAKYLIPWNTKERAITGGAIFIGSSYINNGQNTVYLQKFDVDNSDGSLYWHQYMTNVLAPYNESPSIYTAYLNSGILSNSNSFIIPIYNNMPDIPVQNPNILESDYIVDNSKVYANVSTTLNVRAGPSTSYEIVANIDRNTVMTRIKKGKQAGELWDMVQLSNGIIGYVFQNYVKEVPKVNVEKINLSIENTTINKGESKKLKVEVLPTDASNKAVTYVSSNTNIAKVDSNGNITGVSSGKATITVKAKENNVSSKIDITVYSKVTGINLNIDNIVLSVGDNFEVITEILPSDASNKNVTYISENEEIASIDENGMVTALSKGEVKLDVISEDSKIKKEIRLIVVRKLDETEVSFDNSLNVQGNLISGFNVDEMIVGKIKQKINTNYAIGIYDMNNELLEDDAIIGTGGKIRLFNNGEIVMEYNIVLYGDVNGDGKINSIDLLVLQRHILEIEKLSGAFLKAGNVQKNGKNPSSVDSLLIQRHILELKLIEQS